MTWRELWHSSIAPLFPTRGLRALATALELSDDYLLRGQTTRDDGTGSCNGCCPIMLALCDGEQLSVMEAEKRFARLIKAMGYPIQIGGFTIGWDTHEITDAELLATVRETLATREPA